MIEQKKQEKIQYHLMELRKLRATPRSDWHAGFEAALRIELHKYGNAVQLSMEEELGTMPPRVDYMILVENRKVAFEKEIFRNFRKFNIIEYKNPRDSLTEQVILKAAGYACLFIGVAEHVGDRPKEEVTISIFRASKNPELFARMEREGTLVRDAVSGIYHVIGIVPLPFQIIITDELQGAEYAAFRALTDRAKVEDVERVIGAAGSAPDMVVKGHYMELFRLVLGKNPQFIAMVRKEFSMEVDEVLMEALKDRIDEKVQAAVAAEKEESQKALAAKDAEVVANNINSLMETMHWTVEEAMNALRLPEDKRGIYLHRLGIVS